MSTKLYDEEVWKSEENKDGELTIQTSYRIRLFKEVIKENTGTYWEHYPIYLLLEGRTKYDVSSKNTNYQFNPIFRKKQTTYVSGSDAIHIRKAIGLIDKFKNEQ